MPHATPHVTPHARPRQASTIDLATVIGDELAAIDDGSTNDAPLDDATGRLFAQLDAMIDRRWDQAAGSNLALHVATHGFDCDLYRDLMVQVFHYTRFNSVNQAFCSVRATPEQRALLRFMYRHADEELGHEQMVVHDLRSVGLISRRDDLADLAAFPRLPATEALIGYVAGVAMTEGAVARLGYSYWAEDVYAHLAPLLGAAVSSLGLTERQMTFFTAHSDIDAGHSAEVRRIIAKVATTAADREAIYRVADTTLWLTHQLMDQAFAAWHATHDSTVHP